MTKITQILKQQVTLIVICFTPLLYSQVGIGTTTPSHQLEIVNTGNIGASTLTISDNSGIDGVSLTGVNQSTLNGYNAIEGGTNGSYSGVYGLYIQTTGIGNGVYGVANSSDGVGVFGTVPTSGTWTGFGGLFTGGLAYANGLYNVSDTSAKSNIIQLTNVLEKLKNINGYQYTYNFHAFNKNMANSEKLYYGFLAQNIQDHFPHAVANKNVRLANDKQDLNDKDVIVNKELTIVDYTALIPILVEATKEQQIIIEQQHKKIKTLESKLKQFELKLNALSKN
ncbi:tail fiber domain-containing protein [Lacinutrix salivirga]